MQPANPAPAGNSLEARDRAHVLHPYANARKAEAEAPLVITGGDGIHVIDADGKRYIEAMSGLWSVGLGFSEHRLAEVAYEQMKALPYSQIFGQRTHGPAADLAEKLVQIAPEGLSKVFFTNSGSEANDTALKLVWYRANAMGQPGKKKIISRQRAYHGITIAASSLTGIAVNHRSFDLIVPDMIRLSCPHHYRDALPGESEEAFATRLAQELEDQILAEGPETIAAFIGEPVMGAGGVVVPPKGYWQKVQAVLRRHDILLIVDEVITGFGRTGNMFACETFDIRPDILVLSKQLSSSYQPISAVLVNERIYGPVADESARIGVLGHGYTAAGHPVCAAVALENIRIIEERGIVANAAAMGERLRAGLAALTGHPLVGELRGVGLLAALELVTDKAARTALEPAGRLGAIVQRCLLAEGVISRASGDALCFCPPMIITAPEVDRLLAATARALDLALAEVSAMAEAEPA